MKLVDKIKSIFTASKKSKKEKIIQYCGYNLYFSEGTSIVERFISTGMYEQKTIQTLVESMQNTRGKIFVDIGANVGLISLAIAQRFTQAKILAFEPGPHQFKLLEKTIEKNKLEKNIFLSQVALSDGNGEAFFHIHQSGDASGDGFLDTGRAGKSKKIKVQTQTLDDWWENNGKPDIDVIKCDTEGAELMVLRGASNTIEVCRPHLLLEIYHTNLLNYPYGSDEIFDWLTEKKYSLYTLDKEQVTKVELKQMCMHESEFIAIPKS